MEKHLPWYLNKDTLNLIASLREKKTTKDEKFKFLIEKDIENLIKPSIEPEYEPKNIEYRKKLNKILLNNAILILDKNKFTNDILELAKISGLFELKYDLWPTDFFEYKYSPAINAWEARLRWLTLFNWKVQGLRKVKYNDIYLIPKFEEKVIKLMNSFGLEFFWYESIVHLLITGVWYLPRNTSIIHLKLKENYIENDSPTIHLEISSKTSKEEILYRWDEIDKLKKKIFPNIKGKIKSRDIKEIFSYKFKNDLKDLADDGKGKYKKNLEKITKKVNRSQKDISDFLSTYKTMPKEIRNQIDILNQESYSEYYFF